MAIEKEPCRKMKNPCCRQCKKAMSNKCPDKIKHKILSLLGIKKYICQSIECDKCIYGEPDQLIDIDGLVGA